MPVFFLYCVYNIVMVTCCVGSSYLLPDKGSSGKRKTKVIDNNQNPVWEDHFSYEKISLEEISKERGLEITVWDFRKGSSSNFIGGVRVGPPPGTASKHEEWMDSIGDEVSHWEAMLTHPTEWVEQWHTLRHTMDPRDVLPAVGVGVRVGVDNRSGSGEKLDQLSRRRGSVDNALPSQVTNGVTAGPRELGSTEVLHSDTMSVTETSMAVPPAALPPVVVETEETKVGGSSTCHVFCVYVFVPL